MAATDFKVLEWIWVVDREKDYCGAYNLNWKPFVVKERLKKAWAMAPSIANASMAALVKRWIRG